MTQFARPTPAAADLSEKKWVLAVQLPGRHSRHVVEARGSPPCWPPLSLAPHHEARNTIAARDRPIPRSESKKRALVPKARRQ